MAKEELVSVIASMWEVDEDVHKVRFVTSNLSSVNSNWNDCLTLETRDFSQNFRVFRGEAAASSNEFPTKVANKSMQRVTARVEESVPLWSNGATASDIRRPIVRQELRSSLRDEGLELQELRSFSRELVEVCRFYESQPVG